MAMLTLAVFRMLPVAAIASVLAAQPAKAQSVAALASPGIKVSSSNFVPTCATPGRLMAYLHARNPKLEARFWSIGLYYMRYGHEMGLRWDYAFFQMMVETRYLEFRRPDGTPATVKPEQNNFAGIGATGGAAGDAFADVATGVQAHLQHVLLYAGEPIAAPIAERTRNVQAWGVLKPWQAALQRPVSYADLARHWAPGNANYGPSIESVANRFYESFCQQPDPVPEQVAEAMRGTRGTAVTDAAAVEEKPGKAVARAAIAEARAGGSVARSGLGAPMVAAAVMTAAKPVVSAPLMPATPAALTPAALPAPAPAPLAPVPAPSPSETADDAVRALVGGKTVALDTPLGTTVPIVFREDGTMTGKAGNLAGMLGAPTDSGKWWAERGRLCQKWTVWFNKELQCIKIKLSGGAVHWTRDDGRMGTAKIVSQ